MLNFPGAVLLLLLVPGCGGEDDSLQAVPPAAQALGTGLKSSLVRVMPLAAKLQSTLVYILNPGSPRHRV
jgi:hypothetical protein